MHARVLIPSHMIKGARARAYGQEPRLKGVKIKSTIIMQLNARINLIMITGAQLSEKQKECDRLSSICFLVVVTILVELYTCTVQFEQTTRV